jgi:hypothetical protein
MLGNESQGAMLIPFSVKKTRIISRLKLKLVALETELGIISKKTQGRVTPALGISS